jgi:hypothetical protein
MPKTAGAFCTGRIEQYVWHVVDLGADNPSPKLQKNAYDTHSQQNPIESPNPSTRQKYVLHSWYPMTSIDAQS